MQSNQNWEKMAPQSAVLRDLHGRRSQSHYIGWVDTRHEWRHAHNSKRRTLRSFRSGR